MIVVPVKEGENIEKALKKFKRKFEKTGVIKELRNRQQYDKPSVLLPRKGSIDKIYYVDTPFWTVDTIFYTVINSGMDNCISN